MPCTSTMGAGAVALLMANPSITGLDLPPIQRTTRSPVKRHRPGVRGGRQRRRRTRLGRLPSLASPAGVPPPQLPPGDAQEDRPQFALEQRGCVPPIPLQKAPPAARLPQLLWQADQE